MGEVVVDVELENSVDRAVFERGHGQVADVRSSTVEASNRFMTTDCVVGPPLSQPFLGQIVLEALDLVIDCAMRTLGPRPESPDYPLLNLR